MSASVVRLLLQSPDAVAERCQRPEGLRDLAVTSLGAIVVGATAFGAVVGSFRGGLQIVYSGLKLPLGLLAALVICTPAFFAFARSLGRRLELSAVAALSLTASARASLVLLALAPVLWLAVDGGLGYHGSVVLASIMYLMAGLSALGIVTRGLGRSFSGFVATTMSGLVFIAVLGQTAWMLRPFFGRPSQEAVPFVRAREGTFSDALSRTSRSARGIYDESRGRR